MDHLERWYKYRIFKTLGCKDAVTHNQARELCLWTGGGPFMSLVAGGG